jgi:glutaminase
MPTPEVRRQIEERLVELHRRHLPEPPGSVTQYYASGRGYYDPEQAGSEREDFAVCGVTVDGEVFAAGDDAARFPLQSISKVFAYALALADRGPAAVLERVGVEPSGDAFSSIVFDERHNRPYNPMVNAGALVTGALVDGRDPTEKLDRLLATLRRFAGTADLDADEATTALELATADHNRATAYLMRSLRMLEGDVEALLELYLRQCSVHVDTRHLALMAATLANGGVNPVTRERALPRARVRDVLSVMYTCGMYDYAGQWAFEVGVPAKSGVSGGILAVIPGKLGIGVFSRGLDAYGNSVRGVRVCKEISERLGLHVFATEAEDALLQPPA